MTNMFSTTYETSRRNIDSGLRNYMLKIYNLMCLGLAMTAVASYACLAVPFLKSIFFEVAPNGMTMGLSGMGTLASFAPILFVLYLSMGINRMSTESAQFTFFLYAVINGIGLAPIGLMYTGASIAKAFFITASVFGAMSIYGHTTKKDLTSMGSFLMIGLIGCLIASIVNIFTQSSAADFAISYLLVAIFTGLIAYDTQKLKEIYYQAGGGEYGQKMAVLGALTLYLDFINLFLNILRILSSRRDN
ncbi:MAG: Bax inhibitor-1/YccA family protein [Rickettsiaceae bacterium]|nr:Bax inhibitor-1/YccA family protein [Rickettsiaceae bacterium]